MHIDHIIPLSLGGETDEANLCLACPTCNQHKGDAIVGFDDGEHHPLYNPRRQNWEDHFKWDDSLTRVIGITPVGRGTVDCLNMNENLTVQARELWVKAGWHPPSI